MIKEIHPKEAYEMLEKVKGATLVDVRSKMEYEYVGHPPNAIHISIKEPPDWQTKQNYVEDVRSMLKGQLAKNLNAPLLMLCRSGVRSGLAAEMLVNGGFTNVYNVLEGFEGEKDKKGHRSTINGWRYYGLPWEQS